MADNGVYRPLRFKTPQILQESIDAYFKDADEKGKRYTITGLCVFLEINRKTLLRYEHSEEWGWLTRCTPEERKAYRESIQKAKLKIEECYESMLYESGSNRGAIFTLKNNYDWQDKKEIETTNNDIHIKLED